VNGSDLALDKSDVEPRSAGVRTRASGSRFDGELLCRAVRATFARRGTPLPLDTPVALSAAFTEDSSKRTQWSGFARKANVSDIGTLSDAVDAVRQFLLEPLQSVARGHAFVRTWRAGGPWRVDDSATA